MVALVDPYKQWQKGQTSQASKPAGMQGVSQQHVAARALDAQTSLHSSAVYNYILS